MKTLERARIRRGSFVVGAVVALALGVVVPASADPANVDDPVTSSKNPAPTKSGQGVSEGSDVFEAMKAAVGLQGMKNQEDLNAFKTWLISLPGVVDQGFYESGWTSPTAP